MKEIRVDLDSGKVEEGVDGGSYLWLPREPVFNEDVETVEPPPDFGTIPWERPKVCPSCGAKFAHSQAEGRCQKCKLPDEVIAMGQQAIVRWKRLQGTPKHKPRPSTHNKKRRGHGR